MMKKCFKCGRKKSLDSFYTHPQMGDGHLGKCKKCTRRDMKLRWDDPIARERIRIYDRERFKTPERKKKVLESARRRKKNRPGRVKAAYRLTNAIRDGKIIRQPCEVCGAEKVQGHHPDYRSPLKVRWLCFKHHREVHGQKTK